MKATIELLTPYLAKELLSMNKANRKVKDQSKRSYIDQMKKGLWKENGEPIIIDKDGVIKDGQHRLLAVIDADFSYNCAIIYDVDCDVMDTIDTGTNRSLPDVLELNGFSYSGMTSSVIKLIIKHKAGKSALVQNGVDRITVTNSKGLDFANSNKDILFTFCKTANRINSNKFKVMTPSEIAFFLWVLTKRGKDYENTTSVISFLEGISGYKINPSSCTYYAFTKMHASKTKKTPMNKTFRFNLIAKTWKLFLENDMPITRMAVPVDRIESI
jgi:hypothetical protein